MTADEIAEVVRVVNEEHRKERESDEFYIPRKEFYDQFQRVSGFLRFYDSTASTIGKVVIGAVLLGLMALAALGSGWQR